MPPASWVVSVSRSGPVSWAGPSLHPDAQMNDIPPFNWIVWPVM
jgi:hypothetical protein